MNHEAPLSNRVRDDFAEDGFTILEILIATAILTVGLMGLLALFPVAMKSGQGLAPALDQSSPEDIAVRVFFLGHSSGFLPQLGPSRPASQALASACWSDDT